MAGTKGILSDNHKKVGVQCACTLKQELIRNLHFWKNDIFLNLDRVSFVHECNPKSGVASFRATVCENQRRGFNLQAKDAKN